MLHIYNIFVKQFVISILLSFYWFNILETLQEIGKIVHK